MKDIRLNIKIKNNLILKRGEELYQTKSQSDLARKTGMHATTLGGLINFKISPVIFRPNKTNRRKPTAKQAIKPNEIANGVYWRNAAIKLSNSLQSSPWEIFPEHLWGEKEKNQYNLEFESSELMLLFSDNETQLIEDSDNPLKTLEKKEIKDNTLKMLTTLRPREEKILKLRFGLEGEEHTLQKIAELENVTGKRIKQIEAKALRKLRAWREGKC